MNKDIRVISTETVINDGQLYLHCTVMDNGELKDFELPFYDEKGNINPDTEKMLLLSKKYQSQVNQGSEENIADNTDENNEYPKKEDLIVYNKPKENARIDRDYKGIMISGFTGLMAGLIIMSAFRGCGKQNDNTITETTKSNSNKITSEAYTEDDIKTVYMSKEEYLNGVQELCNHLNNNLGFEYKPVDLNAFYYSANMDKIKEDTFNQLVEEGYLPDTDIAIMESTFAITSDLKTKVCQTSNMNIDFNKVFIDKEMKETSEKYKDSFNRISTSSNDTVKSIIDDLQAFIITTPEKGYNTLPTGGKFIFNLVIADSISIEGFARNIPTTEAFDDKIKDATMYVKGLQHNLNCMAIDETEKQLIK